MSNLTSWSKNDCARVIVQVLMDLEEPAKADCPEVLKLVKKNSKARLNELRDQAIETRYQKWVAQFQEKYNS